MTIKAIYRDVADPNNQFSGVVVRTADGWRIQTDEGPRNIEYYIQEETAVGGVLEFVDYEIYSEQNLRPADIIPYINSVRATLPWPVKPADPPRRAEPDDSRIHIEPRQPGESSFAQLKEAGNKAASAYRANRERERQQVQREMQASSQQIAQVRNINNYLAAQMRPKRSTGE